jgi:hypothetical protein
MSLLVPSAVNYPSPLNYVRWAMKDPAPEGNAYISCEVDWATMGGANKAVAFNLQQNATQGFSQIVALVVDNSNCGADVQFVFTDSGDTLTVPAYSPKVICPVFTASRTFYLVSQLDSQEVLTSDVTRFLVCNFMPPPIAVPTSLEQSIAAVGGIDMATASTVLVPATISGTLEGLVLTLGVNASNSGNGTWQVVDGNAIVLAEGSIAVSSGAKVNLTLFNNNNMRVRFANGLFVTCTETAVLGAIIAANAYYRTP